MINYVKSKTDKEIIKKSTMSFVDKLSEKNRNNITESAANNFIEYIKSIIFVYDNYKLNNEILDRIKTESPSIEEVITMHHMDSNTKNEELSKTTKILKK